MDGCEYNFFCGLLYIFLSLWPVWCILLVILSAIIFCIVKAVKAYKDERD